MKLEKRSTTLSHLLTPIGLASLKIEPLDVRRLRKLVPNGLSCGIIMIIIIIPSIVIPASGEVLRPKGTHCGI
jgi:hypothetical protein